MISRSRQRAAQAALPRVRPASVARPVTVYGRGLSSPSDMRASSPALTPDEAKAEMRLAHRVESPERGNNWRSRTGAYSPDLRRADVPQGSSSLAGACTGRHSFEGVT